MAADNGERTDWRSRWEISGATFKSWQGTGRCGGRAMLPPYTPSMGMSNFNKLN